MSTIGILYDKFRKQVEHEDFLINHRTTWLVAIQAFFMTAFSFLFYNYYSLLANSIGSEYKMYNSGKLYLSVDVIHNSPNIGDRVSFDGYQILLGILPFVALLISALSYLSIKTANAAIGNLKIKWKTFMDERSIRLSTFKLLAVNLNIQDERMFIEQNDFIAMLSYLTDGSTSENTTEVAGYKFKNSRLSTMLPNLFFFLWLGILFAVLLAIIFKVGLR